MEYQLYSEGDILERVDEYTLYCFYLGFQPLIGAKYHSPIRRALGQPDDDNPSFGIKECTSRKFVTHDFIWVDSAIAKDGAGNIFKLVQLLFRYQTRREALLKVMADFKIGGHKDDSMPVMPPVEKIYAEPAFITITPRAFRRPDYDYWHKFNVDKRQLARYNVQAFSSYWLTESQTKPSFPKGPGYAYQIFDKYQLYFPEELKKFKFRNDWTEVCVPGYAQLKYQSDLLVITKAYKDVMCLDAFGYESIAPRGENILVPELCMIKMRKKYKRIVILFDNDGKSKANEYPEEKVYVPEGDKDPTDFCKHHGIKAAAEMLRSIIRP